MKNVSKIKTKRFSFTISILGLLLLISSITSCSSNTPTDEIPPVAKDVQFINDNSRQIWRDNSERYLQSVEKNIYEKGGITQTIIDSNQQKDSIITVDEAVFLIQSCQYGNPEACAFIESRQNLF